MNFQNLYRSLAETLGLDKGLDVKVPSKAGVISSRRDVVQSDLDVETITSKVEPPAISKPINLSFNEPMLGNQPTGWFNSLMFVDNVSLDYSGKIVLRPDSSRGVCVLFQNPNAATEEFGSLMQRTLVGRFAGNVLRLEGEIKIEGVENWAGMWIRADGKEQPNLFFDNMYDRRLRGTVPWRTYTLDAPLPSKSVWLNFGIVLVGSGKVWADNFRLLFWDNGQWQDVSNSW